MHGRPRATESRRRRRRFITLLEAGASFRDAARDARIDGDAIVTMLDVALDARPELRGILVAVLDEQQPAAIGVAA